jgi:hypothetical protein
MAQYVDRRYRLNVDEIPIVLELVRLRLQELVKAKRDLEAARTLFRVLYRHEAYQPGRPGYPESITWGTLAEYLNEVKVRAAILEEVKNYGN